jgi:iron complex transport system substrate-binding protein
MGKKKFFVAGFLAILSIVVIILLIVEVVKTASVEEIVVEREPKRPSALCLSPSFVEMMYRINSEDYIAAVTDGCDFPSDAKTLPNLGSSIKLDWKRVDRMPIDVVMLLPNHTIEHARFAKMDKRVIVGGVDSLDSICNTMWAVGQLYKKEDSVEQWMIELDLTLTVLKKKIVTRDARGEDAPKIAFVLDHKPDFSGKIIVAGMKLFYNDVIKKAGAENVFQQPVETGALTMEELVALKPDIIIEVAPPVAYEQKAEYVAMIKSSWDEKLNAVKQDKHSIKVEVFAESWARRPGPRVIELIDNVGKIVFQ